MNYLIALIAGVVLGSLVAVAYSIGKRHISSDEYEARYDVGYRIGYEDGGQAL